MELVERLFRHKRPKGIEDYILDHANKGYLIRTDAGTYCTRKRCWCDECCEERLGHGDFYECICCPEDGECYCMIHLHGGRGRKKRQECGRILWMRKEGRNTLLQMDYYWIDYTGIKPEVYFNADAQYRLGEEKKEYRRKQNYFLGDEQPDWRAVKNIRLAKPYIGSWMYESRWDKLLFYEPSMNSLGSDLKYADITPLLPEHADCIVEYILQFLKHQSIELLQKSGFENIIIDRLMGNKCRYINWRGKSLQTILKCNRNELKLLRGKNMDYYDKYMCIKEMGLKLKPDELTSIHTKYGLDKFVEAMRQYGIEPEKAIRYCTQQKARIEDYRDYIRDCMTLQLNIRDRHIARPKDFYDQHNKTSKLVQSQLSKKEAEMFEQNEKRITEMEEPYIKGKLLIRPAKDQMELQKESAALKHCVRTYGKKVAEGKCAILFIRETEKPDEPYYTLELDDTHRVVQCRGMQNRNTSKDIDVFISQWTKEQYGRMHAY